MRSASASGPSVGESKRPRFRSVSSGSCRAAASDASRMRSDTSRGAISDCYNPARLLMSLIISVTGGASTARGVHAICAPTSDAFAVMARPRRKHLPFVVSVPSVVECLMRPSVEYRQIARPVVKGVVVEVVDDFVGGQWPTDGRFRNYAMLQLPYTGGDLDGSIFPATEERDVGGADGSRRWHDKDILA